MRHFSVNVRQKLRSPFPVLVTPADGLLKNLQFPGGRSLQNLSPLLSPSSLFALSLSSAKIQYGAQTDVFVRTYEDSFVKFPFSSERVKGSRPSQQSVSFTCDLGAWFRLIRSTTQILARKVDFCGGRKTGESVEKPSESDWDQPITAHVRAQDRTRVAVVRGEDDDCCANLTPENLPLSSV